MTTSTPWVRRDKEPFELGNLAAAKHEANSARRFMPIADAIQAEILAGAARPGSSTAYLLEPSYVFAIRSFAETTARRHLVLSWLDGMGDLDQDGIPRPATNLAHRLDTRAETLRGKLGLDPFSRARLGRDLVAIDDGRGLDAVASAGVAGLERRAAALEAAGEVRTDVASDD